MERDLLSVNRWEHDGTIWKVEVEFSVIDGRAEPVTLKLSTNRGRAPIRAAVLRALPLGQFVGEQRKQVAARSARLASNAQTREQRTGGQRRALAYGGRAVSLEHLEAVAAIYIEAHARGAHPSQAVAEHFDRPGSTARKWVMKAREAGLLTETEQRQAGGVPPAKRRRSR